MLTPLDEPALAGVCNPVMREYAARYPRIYGDFLDQVRAMGIEIDPVDHQAEVDVRMETLRRRGVRVRNDRKSLVVNHLSAGCVACQTGTGSATYFVSLRCHRDCFFCFNPNQENYEFFRDHTRDLTAELAQLRASGQRVSHLALTGGEPLLFKDETIAFFRYARENFPGVYTRLYTCGDHFDRQTLQALRAAALDEVRFSLRLHDTQTARQHTFAQIALAREYVPHVMVEMPVLPGALQEMQAVLLELDRLGAYGINLLELCFPLHNAAAFRERGYRVKARPFRVLYDYWYAGGLPVSGSELDCLDLLAFALDRDLKLGVHYCSVENKHSGQIYQQNAGRSVPGWYVFSQRDYFWKTAKVFGQEARTAHAFFERAGDRRFAFDRDNDCLQFYPGKVRALRGLVEEVGISYNVYEERADGPVLRELRLDLTTPQTFRISSDL